MASRFIASSEEWKRVYEAFDQINFSSFDYEVVKQSLIDYLKLYFPEQFNDFIESSELIAIIENFAYVSEIMAFRIDAQSTENFMSTAQRKSSILRLAKLISYKATRNLPARGVVKFTSISTSESVIDSDGNNIANTTIIWNDNNNPKWKEQFFLVMDRILAQNFGTVSPSDRIQVDDVLFELYQLKQIQSGLTNGIFSYNVTVSNDSLPMELTPVSLNENGPYETRPDIPAGFTIFYASDGLGDGSDHTGFFFLTKQGTLSQFIADFDGITPNQTLDLDFENINDIDVWINNVDPNTNVIVDDGSVDSGRSGEWEAVDIANAQNIIFNTNTKRNKYEIETLEDDKIRVIFGDGEFSEIPAGRFHIWTRSSANSTFTIPQNSINQIASFTYFDDKVNIQTFSVNFILTNAIQNASVSEDIDSIRSNAPSVYYSQDRMVNGRDYNTFMLQDPSIIKLRATNRTFAGDSKYIEWHDPNESYENVKLFGDDLAVYYTTNEISFNVVNKLIEDVLDDEITDLLQQIDVFLSLSLLPDNNPTRRFSDAERDWILGIGTGASNSLGLNNMIVGTERYLIHFKHTPGSTILWWDTTVVIEPRPPEAIFKITKTVGTPNDSWIIDYLSSEIVSESSDTRFWNTNVGNAVITYDTLQSSTDQIVLLQANVDRDRTGIATENSEFNVLSHVLIPSGLPDAGLPNIHQLAIVPNDENGDNIPDDVNLSGLFNPQVDVSEQTVPFQALLPIYYINGESDISGVQTSGVVWNETGTPSAKGYQIADYSGTVVGTDPTGLTNDATVYTASASFNGGVAISITITGSLAQTFDDLINEINSYIGASGNATIESGNIKIENALITGPSSTVLLTNTDLFSSTTPPFSGFLSPQNGVDGDVSNEITVTAFPPGGSLTITITDYVYFYRETILDLFQPIPATLENIQLYVADDTNTNYKRELGRYPFNFLWMHKATTFKLIDPAASNIIDIFIIQRAYYTNVKNWVDGLITNEPAQPTAQQLRSDYADLLDNKMISDTVILHTGKFKILFGQYAVPDLKASFKVIRSSSNRLTDNQIKTTIVTTVRNFFDISLWEFGETFYFSELAAAIHTALPGEIDSVVLVPTNSNNIFGDLYQVNSSEDEVFIPNVSVNEVEIVESLNPEVIKQSA